MRKLCYLAAGATILALLPLSAQQPKTEEKAATRTLKVKLNYTGTGKVDEKHKIIVFLFDSPDFMQGGVMPLASKFASAKDVTVTFPDLSVSPVYAAALYDPSGEYDGQSGPPPSGSSAGLYATTPGQPEPIAIEAGKTVQVDLAFDDSFKVP